MKGVKEIKGLIQYDGKLQIEDINNTLCERFPLEQPCFFKQKKERIFFFEVPNGHTIYRGIVIAPSKKKALKQLNNDLIDFDIQKKDLEEMKHKSLKIWEENASFYL